MKRKLPPLAALAMVAVIGTGCANGVAENGDAGNAGAGGNKKISDRAAVQFAECMRDNGVSRFPDPDASGELTIDGVVNGSSLDPSAAAWKEAIAACRDLQPRGSRATESEAPRSRMRPSTSPSASATTA